ncbi:MAG: nucleotidyltransferase domain-containing protein [Planctomycetes bacterium]|nr:nucleotidyltransferase domain-containing protein [Planctomycetota bacterium]
MAKKDILRAVRFLVRRLEAHGLSVTRVLLFGSQARGAAGADSDVDLAIVSDDFRGKDAIERAEMTIEAEIETLQRHLVPFDIVTLTPDELGAEASPLAQFAGSGVAL